MQHKTMALATALACVAGTAIAESNVALYGTLDTGIGRTYRDKASTNLETSYTSTSRLGFRGSENLGHGLKANFQLEWELESDTGAFDTEKARQSWVGISGGFGEFMLGRTTTPQNRFMGKFDLNGTADGSSAMKILGIAANSSLLGSRQSNQIQYATPKISGWQARVAYGFSETTNGPKAKKDFLQLAASYQVDSLTLAAAFQPKSQSLQRKTDHTYRNGYALGAKYDFGIAEASVLYTRNETITEGDGWGFGLAAPLGAWTVGAQFARLTKVKRLNGTKSAKQGANAYELFSNYRLSKRTALYMAYGSVNHQAESSFSLKNGSTYAVGVIHKF